MRPLVLVLLLLLAAAGPAASCEAGGRRYSAAAASARPGAPPAPAPPARPCRLLPPLRAPRPCYGLGQRFRPSEYEQCICDPDGIARCLVADCAPPPCVNAVYETGHCCPTCQDGPNCYVDWNRMRVMPAGEAVWVEPCTRCRCHHGQDIGYWEGNRMAKCEWLRNCHLPDRHNS
ncbi:von Willebrand factor C domain-containing protein 2-like [Gopherus evgoodei]|uniref:von Willebrand factor C domain-containing protein 2-like n=1 Tax=Gopherus evgoodei TaxID=1825980 RepID=UPI0011CF1E83|nr:von Willebrand factor C domain-containing protein 2-like [Gopherus evgoodei]